MIKRLLSIWNVPVLVSCKKGAAPEKFLKKTFTDFDEIEFILIYEKIPSKWYNTDDKFKLVQYTIKSPNEIYYQSQDVDGLDSSIDWSKNLNSLKFKNLEWHQIGKLDDLMESKT